MNNVLDSLQNYNTFQDESADIAVLKLFCCKENTKRGRNCCLTRQKECVIKQGIKQFNSYWWKMWRIKQVGSFPCGCLHSTASSWFYENYTKMDTYREEWKTYIEKIKNILSRRENFSEKSYENNLQFESVHLNTAENIKWQKLATLSDSMITHLNNIEVISKHLNDVGENIQNESWHSEMTSGINAICNYINDFTNILNDFYCTSIVLLINQKDSSSH